MANLLEYTLSLQDQMSSKLQKIGVNSTTALNIFAKLEKQSKDLEKVFKATGGSIGGLRAKVQQLKAEREWIPAGNLNDIRKYNREIKKLDREIQKLETLNGGKLKKNLQGAVQSLPFSEFITNPVTVAGAALFQSGKMALNFEEGMAKINTTAQLSKEKLAALKNNLIDMGVEAGANLDTIPDAFEKILSQTGDVALSQDILKTSLKGSKAGFTDTAVVSGALAQSLSLIGKENANAQEVLDTFFAAKRVGAGEFQDFANYMPSLISSGKSLGVTYKQTAGLFAYMTGKGFAAEKSTTLLENAFSALGKIDIQKNFKGAGIDIFNKDGAMRDMGVIMGELEAKMAGMSDEGKSSFLAKMGLTDKEARSAMIVLASDGKKLKESLNATAEAQGETDAAFERAKNPLMDMQKLWSQMQKLAIKLGGVLSAILIPVFTGLTIALTPVLDLLGWIFDKIAEGNPIMMGAIGIIATLTGLYYAKALQLKLVELWQKRSNIQMAVANVRTKAAAIWQGIATGATLVWAGAQWILNKALTANPIGIIIAAVAALVAGIIWVASVTTGWGSAWDYTIKGAKFAFLAFVYGVKANFNTLVNGIMVGINMIKLGWYKFKEAMGIGDNSENQAMIDQINQDTEARKKSIVEGYEKAAEYAVKSAGNLVLAGASIKMKKDVDEDKGVETGIDDPAKVVDETEVEKNNDNKDEEKNKLNKSIATGGTRSKTVNITLKNLIEKLDIHGKGFKESAKQMETDVADGLLRVLAMAETS